MLEQVSETVETAEKILTSPKPFARALRSKADQRRFERLSRKLRRTPLGQLAISHPPDIPLSPDQFQMLLDTMRQEASSTAPARELASLMLVYTDASSLGDPEQTIPLLGVLLTERDDKRKSKIRAIHRVGRAFALSAEVATLIGLAVGAYVAVTVLRSEDFTGPPKLFVACLVILILGILSGSVSLAVLSAFILPVTFRRENHIRERLVAMTGRLQIIELTYAIAIASKEMGKVVPEAASLALFATLPNLRTSHYGLLHPESTICLVRLLESSDVSLVLLVLDALEKVGSGMAIDGVEKLAQSSNPIVRNRAEEILPILRERRRRENDAALLLRPSELDSSLLLRPASFVPEANPENLLRPVYDEQDDA